MPYTPLSRNFTIGSVYARAEMKCNQVKLNAVQAPSIIEAMKHRMMILLGLAGGTVRKWYNTIESVNVAAGVIDISALNVLEINALASEFTDPYTMCDSFEEFTRVQNSLSFETKSMNRYYYLALGSGKIYVYTGASISPAPTALNLVYVRTPDTSFTQADIQANTKKIDVPDLIVPYVANGAAVDALTQANIEVTKALQDDFAASLTAINDRMTAENMRLSQSNKDFQ